jgi:hypothetical protein
VPIIGVSGAHRRGVAGIACRVIGCHLPQELRLLHTRKPPAAGASGLPMSRASSSDPWSHDRHVPLYTVVDGFRPRVPKSMNDEASNICQALPLGVPGRCHGCVCVRRVPTDDRVAVHVRGRALQVDPMLSPG